jgi:hypothetical protein
MRRDAKRRGDYKGVRFFYAENTPAKGGGLTDGWER